ncbi:MAG TPA: hypothetical protein VK972_00705 [Wenzhouxiangella sp.]|nr:hypothetical protein [Wenzhouxiangella sp.]
MSKKKLSTALHNLSESAFDFLERSVEEIKAHPKYSVIHFATAVELILNRPETRATAFAVPAAP